MSDTNEDSTMSLFEIVREQYGAMKASVVAKGAPTVSAGALVAKGVATFAEQLDALFAADDGWRATHRSVLVLGDGEWFRYNPVHWTDAPGVDYRHGGWVSQRDFEAWFAARLPNAAPAWFFELPVRVVAIVDGTPHVFASVDGEWLEGAQIDQLLAEQARQAAEQRRHDAEQFAEEDRRRAADEAERQATLAAEQAAANARAAEERATRQAAAERAAVERAALVEANLGATAADPSTILAIAEMLDLLAPDGTLRRIVREDDLATIGGVRVSPAAGAAIDAVLAAERERGGVRISESDRDDRVRAAAQHVAIGAHAMHLNFAHPYGAPIVAELTAVSNGLRVVLIAPAERAPLAWSTPA
ncbi:MAG: hypothetical protein HYV09_40585 [Deltaproteobacteria bacterium]|nr:hypothetical protein [Deltaproteobacteria bacterium]